jgi:hypothetical protein
MELTVVEFSSAVPGEQRAPVWAPKLSEITRSAGGEVVSATRIPAAVIEAVAAVPS